MIEWPDSNRAVDSESLYFIKTSIGKIVTLRISALWSP